LDTPPLSLQELESIKTVCYLASKNGQIDPENLMYNFQKPNGQQKSIQLSESDFFLLTEALQHRNYLNHSLAQFSFQSRFDAGNTELLTRAERQNNRQWIQMVNNQQVAAQHQDQHQL
jgi:hypothetical protein